MEEGKKAEGGKTGNAARQHQRLSRRSLGSRNSRLNNGDNMPQQGDTEATPNSFEPFWQNSVASGRNTSQENSSVLNSEDTSPRREAEVDTPNNFEDIWQNMAASGVNTAQDNSADSDASDFLNRSGLNGIRQLLDDVDAQLPCIDDAGSNPSNVQSSVGVSNSLRNRTASPSSHRGERRRARRRIQHQNPGQLRAETFVRNTSPSRHGRQYHSTSQHIPPLRFSSALSESPPATSPTVEHPAARFVDGLFGPTRHLGPFPNPYFRGYGTEDDPYELSPGVPDEPSSPPAFDGVGNLQSDEEIARQLQQEEWEAAGSYSRLHSRQPRGGGGFNSFHFPHRRGRSSELSPLRLSRSWAGSRGGQSSSRESSMHHLPQGSSGSQAAGNLPVFRPGYRRRSQDEPLPMRSRLEHWSVPSEDLEGSYGNLALLTDLLGSYGLSDLADFEAILNPGALGQRPFINPDFMDYESLLALGEQLGEVSKGMEDAEINKLTICRHKTSPNRQGASASAGSNAEPPQCNICLNDYENGDEKRMLPCKHDFHKQCVDQWLQTNATCPICRSDVRKKES